MSNNVLENVLNEGLRKGVKAVLEQLADLDAKELVENTADICNLLFKDILKMKVNEDGSVKLTATLSADEVKFLLKEINKQL